MPNGNHLVTEKLGTFNILSTRMLKVPKRVVYSCLFGYSEKFLDQEFDHDASRLDPNFLNEYHVLVREGGLEDESIVNKDLQVHLERYLHPGSPHLSHSAPWKDFGLLQPAYQMLTVINQPIQNHRAR
jgi:hypothetical protein